MPHFRYRYEFSTSELLLVVISIQRKGYIFTEHIYSSRCHIAIDSLDTLWHGWNQWPQMVGRQREVEWKRMLEYDACFETSYMLPKAIRCDLICDYRKARKREYTQYGEQTVNSEMIPSSINAHSGTGTMCCVPSKNLHTYDLLSGLHSLIIEVWQIGTIRKEERRTKNGRRKGENLWNWKIDYTSMKSFWNLRKKNIHRKAR